MSKLKPLTIGCITCTRSLETPFSCEGQDERGAATTMCLGIRYALKTGEWVSLSGNQMSCRECLSDITLGLPAALEAVLLPS